MILEDFEVFENTFDYKVLWMVGKGEWNSVGFFGLWSLYCGLSVDLLGVVFACDKAESG